MDSYVGGDIPEPEAMAVVGLYCGSLELRVPCFATEVLSHCRCTKPGGSDLNEI